ncbi:hypothetical protein ACFSVM_04185 [Paenibacillus shunpengii]|uniref:DUF5067 domain-containing protein n=1 Tax=Paenibacillus shunpengii TaxID=2054424 RepID=A0ABW5SIR4_9BACL|nr:hypothetical protein [Paenibacillus sp. PDC88]
MKKQIKNSQQHNHLFYTLCEGKMMSRFHPRFYLLVCIIIFTLTACSSNTNTSFYSNGYNEIEELEKLDDFIRDQASESSKPVNYDLTVTSTFKSGEDANMIVYDVLVNNVKEEMENITISFTLEPEMINNLESYDLISISNPDNVKKNILKPNEKPFGLSLYRGYVLKEEGELSKNINNIYKNVYVKISYDTNGKRTDEYRKMVATPSTELVNYLKETSSL